MTWLDKFFLHPEVEKYIGRLYIVRLGIALIDAYTSALQYLAWTKPDIKWIPEDDCYELTFQMANPAQYRIIPKDPPPD